MFINMGYGWDTLPDISGARRRPTGPPWFDHAIPTGAATKTSSTPITKSLIRR